MNKIIMPGLHPKVVEAMLGTISEAKGRGLTVSMHSGLRTEDEQNYLYNLGRILSNKDGRSIEKPLGNIVTNAKAWQSWHGYGLSVDIVFKDKFKNWTWNVSKEDWDQLGISGELNGFEWGGRWEKFKDKAHFQMKGGLAIDEAKNILFEQGVEKLWERI